eukprot:gene84-239_t
MSRLSRHREAVRAMAAAASSLRDIKNKFAAAKEQAAAAGVPLTQKQYLELSETVMKVLFALDAVTCGPAMELRGLRKSLTTDAN